jgi:hypothetical protein
MSHSLPVCVGVLIVAGLSTVAQAQQTRIRVAAPEKSIEQQLSELLEPVNIIVTSAVSSSQTAGTKELRVRWTTGSAAAIPGPPAARPVLGSGAFIISGQRKYSEPAHQQLSMDLGPGRLFIAAIDRTRVLRSWKIILDPRVIRSEGPGLDGTLTGQTQYLEDAEFVVAIPDDPDIVELRLFEVLPDGQAYRLSSAGSLPIER